MVVISKFLAKGPINLISSPITKQPVNGQKSKKIRLFVKFECFQQSLKMVLWFEIEN